ncbi:MAG: SpoIIE family protein phosphatase [Cytophagales bacterium]
MKIPDSEEGLETAIEIEKCHWQEELDNTAKRYHIIGAWIAIIFDPIFAFTDFLNIPGHFTELLSIRLSVSFLTIITYFFYKKYNFQSYWLVLVPFMLISFQNAYTFMLIDEASIMGHSLNYIALFIGGGMFILWPLPFSIGVVAASVLMTYLFFNLNPNVDGDVFWVGGGLLKLVVEFFMIVLIYSRYRLTKKEIIARLALEKSKDLLSAQKSIIQKKNDQLVDSLQYAKRIQEALLGDQKRIKAWFDGGFILFEPKDIVSGDFYWLYKHPERDIRILMAGDCTGHGVPAALMTVLGNSILTDLVEHKGIYLPDQILKELDNTLLGFLKKHKDEFGNVNDGMDISILTFMDQKIYFSAAKNPLVIINGENIEQIKGSKYAIGGFGTEEVVKEFDLHLIEHTEKNHYYLFSDGFQDQFGGPKGKKYMTKRFRNTLMETCRKGINEQENDLDEIFKEWKGENPQTDDVLVIGVKI